MPWLCLPASLAVCCAGLATGCNGDGQLSLHFAWEDAAPTEARWLNGTVYDARAGAESNVVAAGEQAWGGNDDGNSLVFDKLRYGTPYFVDVELSPCKDPEACSEPEQPRRPDYAGRSQPFVLVRGQHTRIYTKLTSAPSGGVVQQALAGSATDDQPLGVQVQTAVRKRVGQHCVPLLLAADTAHLPDAVEISSVSLEAAAALPGSGSGSTRCRLPAVEAGAAAATEGLAECGIELLNSSTAAGVTEWRVPGWSLCAGHGICVAEEAGMEPGCPSSAPASGELRVRFARGELYSVEYPAHVDLDVSGPVVSPKVSTRVAGPTSQVCLDLVATEDLSECGPVSAFQRVEGGAWQALPDVRLAPVLTDDERSCHVCFEGQMLPDGDYAFGARVRDLVGNAGCLERESCGDQCPGGACPPALDTDAVLSVDSTLPKLREAPHSSPSWPKHAILPDQVVPFELEFDERVEPMVVTLAGETAGVNCLSRDQRHFSCTVSTAANTGDGPRLLAARVGDAAGNSTVLALGGLDFDVDSPHATATLTRVPELTRTTGLGGSAAKWFTASDPFVGQAVLARLSVLTDKSTSTPSLELVEADLSAPARPGCPEQGPTAGTLPAPSPAANGKGFGLEVRVSELLAQLGLASRTAPGRALYCLRARFNGVPGGSAMLEPLLGLAWGTPDNRLDLAQTFFRRRPWGSADGDGQPDFSVQAYLQPAASDAPFPVSDVVLSTDPRGQARIATTAASGGFDPASTGPLHIQLPQSLSASLAELYAASADAAGNVSDFRLIERGEWLATLNRRGPFANPHRAFALGAAPQMLEPSDPGVEIHEQLSRRGDAPADTTAEVQWFQLLTGSDEDVPPARSGHALAYDAARGVTVLFGGEAHCGRMLDDTWEWDGLRWRQLRPAGKLPSPRRDTRMVYDAARGRTLLFGGALDGTALADTWEWDGRAWTQRADGPPRHAHALAYDPRRGEVLLMGGASNTSPCTGDTWRWNGERWLQVEADRPDLCRSNHAMTFDTHMGQDQHGALLLFGGVDMNTCTTFRDTWVWSGQHWEPVSTPTPSPLTTQHSMVTDEQGSAVALGGAETLLACENEPDQFRWPKPQEPLVWHKSGAASGEWQVKATSPAPCSSELDEDHCVFIDHASVFDSARKRLVTVGGRINLEKVEPPLRRTWLLEGTRWREPPSTAKIVDDPTEQARDCPAQDDPRVPTSAPSARAGHSLIAVPAADAVALFGGRTANGEVVGDTWSWDGSRWLPQGEGEPSPAPRYRHALLGLAATSALLFGGLSGLDENESLLGDAWTLSFSTPAGEWQWEQQDLGACTASVNVARHSAAVTGSGFSFGGTTAPDVGTGDLLSWNAGCWTVSGAVGPRPDVRRSAALAPLGASLVLFAGQSASPLVLGDTWRYDIQEQSWSNIPRVSGAPAPVERAGHTLTPSTSGGNVLLLGGRTLAGDALDDAWVFDGQGWTKVSASRGVPQPGPLAEHAVVVPPGSKRGLLFGGTQFTSDEATNQTWAWAFPDHPAHTVLVEASGIGCAEPGTEQISARRLVLTRVRVHAVAGGGPSPTGAELWVWNGQGWVSRAFNDAGPAALEPVDWETTDRETLLALAAGRTLGVQLRPLARPEPSPARLLTDLVEVALDYRLDAAAPEAPHDTSFCPLASLRAP